MPIDDPRSAKLMAQRIAASLVEGFDPDDWRQYCKEGRLTMQMKTLITFARSTFLDSLAPVLSGGEALFSDALREVFEAKVRGDAGTASHGVDD